MTDPPRRMPPTSAEMERNALRQHTPGALLGWSRSTRPAPNGQAAIASPADIVADMDPVVIGSGAQAPGGSGSIAIGVDPDASGIDSAAVGLNAAAAGDHTYAIGEYASGPAAWSVAIGPHATVNGDQAVAIGTESIAGDVGAGTGGGGGVAVGFDAKAFGVNSLALGALTTVGAAGSPADNAVAIGSGASTTTADEFVLGTNNHIVVIKGRLVIADGSGGLHQIVVDTGGVLSTTPYP